MYIVVYQNTQDTPRVIAIHRTLSAAENTAAWFACVGATPWSLYEGMPYGTDIEMPYDIESEAYVLKVGSEIEKLWVLEVEPRK